MDPVTLSVVTIVIIFGTANGQALFAMLSSVSRKHVFLKKILCDGLKVLLLDKVLFNFTQQLVDCKPQSF